MTGKKLLPRLEPGYLLNILKEENHDRHDAIIPYLQTLRTNSTVSDAMANWLASYEAQTHSDLAQGKPHTPKHTGRYNTHDIIFGQAI